MLEKKDNFDRGLSAESKPKPRPQPSKEDEKRMDARDGTAITSQEQGSVSSREAVLRLIQRLKQEC